MTSLPRSKLILSKLIAFVCVVCNSSVSNKVNVQRALILPTSLEKNSIKPWFPRGLVFFNDFSYRTTTLVFKPVLESKVVVNIFDYHWRQRFCYVAHSESLRFREMGGRFWGECQLYHRKFSNSYCLLFCFNSNCNRLLLQIKTPIFHFLSRQKLETINDVLSISLLIGSIVDRLEINSTDFVVSYHFILLNDR